MTSSARKALLVVHPTREDARSYAKELATKLQAVGFDVSDSDSTDAEIAVVLGGDGTILRAAQLCRGKEIPILGVNLGNVGFMAEIQKPSIEEVVSSLLAKSYKFEPRLVAHYSVQRDGDEISLGWSLNEVVIEGLPGSMIELFVQIDSRPLSRWGCDGVICATPTGSTAYAFSAGGPVVWPEVPALVLLPIAAHALFSFSEQSPEYRNSVIPADVKARVSIEAGVALSWRDIIGDAGVSVSLEHFGASASAATLFKEFGFTAENVANAALHSIKKVGR